MTWSVMIVGLGAIGMKYDYESSEAALILSHSKALHAADRFNVVAAVDPIEENRSSYEKKYYGKTFKSLDSALLEFNPDVVVIATPTKFHLKGIKKIVQVYRPKFILCEKPMAYNLKDAEEAVRLCGVMNVPLFVNFFRQSDPGYIKMIRMVNDGHIRPPFKGVVWYTKGLVHNGLHFIALLTAMFGPFNKVEVLGKPRNCGSDDFEVDLQINFADAKVLLVHAWEEFLSHYSLEILAGNGRILSEHHNYEVSFQPIVDDEDFNGYKKLGGKILFPENLNYYQANVVAEIENYLLRRDYNLFSGEDNLSCLQLTDKIRELIK
jgi:predicted dehydrogenase